MLNAYRDKSMKTRFATDDDVRHADNLMRTIALDISNESDNEVTLEIAADLISPQKVRAVQYAFRNSVKQNTSDISDGAFNLNITFAAGKVICNGVEYPSARDHEFISSVNSIVSAAVCGREFDTSSL